MITIIEDKENIIYTHASGFISHEDYKLILPSLKGKIKRFSRIRWYIEMDDSHTWEPGAVWEDFKFDLKFGRKIEKMAIVGSSKAENFITQIMRPFIGGEVKYFLYEEKEQAKKWIETENIKSKKRKKHFALFSRD